MQSASHGSPTRVCQVVLNTRAPWADVLNRYAPEITLRNFRANNGWGYLDLLRSLLPDRRVLNEYIRIPHPVLDAALGFEAPFDTSNSIPAERDRLVHKA